MSTSTDRTPSTKSALRIISAAVTSSARRHSSSERPRPSTSRRSVTARLYGEAGYARLRAARVAVVGVGGVGSWSVEALARSGVAELTLIDLDHVAESNVNRQVQALGRTLGQAKVQALAERIADIHPGCSVHCVEEFATPDVAVRYLRAMYGMNVKEAAARVRCPTLVLHPKDDEMVRFEQGRRLASLIPGSHFVPLEGRNHIPFPDEPAWEGFVRETRRFLGTNDEPTGRAEIRLTERQLEVLRRIA